MPPHVQPQPCGSRVTKENRTPCVEGHLGPLWGNCWGWRAGGCVSEQLPGSSTVQSMCSPLRRGHGSLRGIVCSGLQETQLAMLSFCFFLSGTVYWKGFKRKRSDGGGMAIQNRMVHGRCGASSAGPSEVSPHTSVHQDLL